MVGNSAHSNIGLKEIQVDMSLIQHFDLCDYNL